MHKPPFPYGLRPMRLADLTSVMSIEKEAFATPWSASAYEYEISHNRLATYQSLTVKEADRPIRLIGYSGFWLIAGELHISTIAVTAAYRGLGLGELLLCTMLQRGFEISAHLATLEVRRSNLVAQSLYRKYLFRVVGERPRYYQGREDAILMTVEPLDERYRKHLKQQWLSLYQRLDKKKQATRRNRP